VKRWNGDPVVGELAGLNLAGLVESNLLGVGSEVEVNKPRFSRKGAKTRIIY